MAVALAQGMAAPVAAHVTEHHPSIASMQSPESGVVLERAYASIVGHWAAPITLEERVCSLLLDRLRETNRSTLRFR